MENSVVELASASVAVETLKYLGSSGAMDVLMYLDGHMKKETPARFTEMIYGLQMNPAVVNRALKAGQSLGIVEQYDGIIMVTGRVAPLTASEKGRNKPIPQSCKAYRLTENGQKVLEHALIIANSH